jgi:hypothetical protein
VRGPWEQCRQTAFADGPSNALRLLESSLCPGAVACGPGGYAVCAAARLRDCDWVWSAGTRIERGKCTERVLTVFDVAGEQFTAVHFGPPEAVAITRSRRAWLTGLAWMRLGASERLLHHTARYLAGRSDGNGPLLRRSVLESDLAEAQLELLEVCATLDREAGSIALVHAQLGRADRGLLRLLGASGFVAERPGQEAYLVELLTHVHVAQPW